MTSITLQGVGKHYGAHQVLFDCNLEIEDGEFIVFVGPSGSGKTTLLRIIAGLEELTEGELRFGDRRVNEVDVGDRDVAMVFQNYGLYPHMSVYDNMAFGLRRRRMERAEIDRRVRGAADMLNMAAYLARKPRQLSGGQRQRVALGRAIVRDPQVFLLDEPLSNLDAHLRMQMRAEILRVHQAVTATAVYVTHDQVEAMTMGDRIVVMNAGRIQQVGTPHEVYDAPVNRFVAAFIGTPAMGFMTATVEDGRVAAGGAEFRLTQAQRQAIGGRRLVEIGIRPERLEPGAGVDWSVHGTTEVVEMLGAEQYVHFRTGDGHLTARVPRDHAVRIGEEVSFGGSARHLYLFDSDTGDRLAAD